MKTYKGDRTRTKNFDRFRDGHENIFGKKEQEKAPELKTPKTKVWNNGPTP